MVNIGEWITYGDILDIYPNITARRIKLWREGKGQAKKHPLRSHKLNKSIYLYNKKDIETLINLTELNKIFFHKS